MTMNYRHYFTRYYAAGVVYSDLQLSQIHYTTPAKPE